MRFAFVSAVVTVAGYLVVAAPILSRASEISAAAR